MCLEEWDSSPTRPPGWRFGGLCLRAECPRDPEPRSLESFQAGEHGRCWEGAVPGALSPPRLALCTPSVWRLLSRVPYKNLVTVANCSPQFCEPDVGLGAALSL